MLAGQIQWDGQGHEVMLFPLDEMYITQGEAPSHGGTLCMDFVGWSTMTGQINLYPYYAPCSCRCVDKGANGDWVVFTSDNPVLCADGVVRTVTWQQGHDNTPCNVNDHFNQGDLIGHTGTRGQAHGDHLHFNTAAGTYVTPWDHTHSESQLQNSIHIYDCCFVNDTIMYHDLGYPWVEYQGPPTPPPFIVTREKKFPWYIIAHKNHKRM